MEQQRLDTNPTPPPPDTGTNHTRVPNILQDLVYPLLSRPEHLCLAYIVRRTEGFTDGAGGRKEVDRISLSQFHSGIQSGAYVLDLGTGLSRPSIRKALDDLQRKGLITVGYKCALCGWEPSEEMGSLTETRGLLCGQCGKTCDRNFGLARMTSKVMLRFLTENDPQHRRWAFDRETKRFFVYTTDGDDTEAQGTTSSKKKQQEDAAARASEDFMRELWFPQLIEQIAEQIEGSMSAGRKLSAAQRLTHVIKPVLGMQKAGDPAVIKYALEQTIARGIPGRAKVRNRADGTVARESNWKWHHYTQRIIEGESAKLAKGGKPTNAQVQHTRTPEAAQETARVLLERAAELNMAGDYAAARRVLADILAEAKQLAPLFGDSSEMADAHLRLAFKYGVTSFRSVRREVPINDFYPDWEWPADLDAG